jgi:hypothetical protein
MEEDEGQIEKDVVTTMKPDFLKKSPIEDFELYKQIAKSPQPWYLSANRLKKAADRLKKIYLKAVEKHRKKNISILKVADDLELIMQYALLIGFAFENMLKAKLVSVLPNKVNFKKDKTGIMEFNWGTHGHDLWDLAIELKKYYSLDLSSQEEEILCYLTLYSLWKGRYPVPKKEEYLELRSGIVTTHIADFVLIDSLYKKIEGADLRQDRNVTMRISGE